MGLPSDKFQKTVVPGSGYLGNWLITTMDSGDHVIETDVLKI